MMIRDAARRAVMTRWVALALSPIVLGSGELARARAEPPARAPSAPGRDPAASVPAIPPGVDPSLVDGRAINAVARAFGRIELKRADGTTDFCYGIFIGPGQVLTSLQGIDEAIEAKMKMMCCGEFEVRGILAVDEAANTVLIAVDTGDADVGVAGRADAAPVAGDAVQLCIPVSGEGVLAVSKKVAEVVDLGDGSRRDHRRHEGDRPSGVGPAAG